MNKNNWSSNLRDYMMANSNLNINKALKTLSNLSELYASRNLQ